MANEDVEAILKIAIESCTTAQTMIDINAQHLDGLRTQCATSAELTQHEIRTLESKLLRLFSRQLVAKRRCIGKVSLEKLKEYPKMQQWLQVVGLSTGTIEGMCDKIHSVEELINTSESDCKEILRKHNAKDEEIRRLLIAVRNLRTYTERQIQGEVQTAADLDLHWESWDRKAGLNSPLMTPRSRSARSSVPSEDLLRSVPTPQSPPFVTSSPSHQLTSSYQHISTSSCASYINCSPTIMTPQGRDRKFTPPPTPPIVGKKSDKKFPTTPPPSKKHQANLLPEAFPLTKSKSHEEHLANRVEPLDSSIVSLIFGKAKPNNPKRLCGSFENLPRRRLATEPGLESSGYGTSLMSSPSRSPPFISPDQQGDGCFVDDCPSQSLSVPRSPRADNFGFRHIIHHRFTATLKVTTCHFCEKPMFIGVKCKECKYRCHRDCVDKVPPSCGLPNELLDAYAQHVKSEGSHSPILGHHITSPSTSYKSECARDRRKRQPYIHIPPLPGPDSSSNTSSCNSSTPSSPALFVTTHTPPSASKHQQFNFPDSLPGEITFETMSLSNEMIETQKSNDSDKTVSGTSGSGSVSTDSEKTLAGRVDSQDSQMSDVDANEKSWPRQNSLSLREWDIPFDELAITGVVGTGRFGAVYKGNWHGNVAIKMLNMDHMDDKKTLETFKQEVAIFRKTRHDNLVLFMGACMKPPQLAIITSLCKGLSLYTHIHERKEKFNLNRTVTIAQQISQGMSYLHARGIVHKDLKTKNIFNESGKAVITDFGLFSVTKLCQGNRKGEWLTIPQGWLCYLSPEVICSLHTYGNQKDDLPFSKASDVYAFGTVWYELLCGDWPFRGQPAEAIIWQIGKGIIAPQIGGIQASRDVKEILITCWSREPTERPDFGKLLDVFSRLPKKRLARSPSHPVHLSRSAESVF